MCVKHLTGPGTGKKGSPCRAAAIGPSELGWVRLGLSCCPVPLPDSFIPLTLHSLFIHQFTEHLRRPVGVIPPSCSLHPHWGDGLVTKTTGHMGGSGPRAGLERTWVWGCVWRPQVLWFPRTTPRTQHIVICTAKTYHGERMQATSAEAEVVSGGDQVSRVLSGGITRDALKPSNEL